MKARLLTLIIFPLISSYSFANKLSCTGYYTAKKLLQLGSSHTEVRQFSSGRKMKVNVSKGSKLETEKTITVVLHGLGKSSSDLSHLVEEAKKRGDTLVTLDLHGFGETAKLNNNYIGNSKIPFEFNRDDVMELLQQIDPQYKIKLVGHSYGGGITLAILEKMKQKKVNLNITKAILLSTFAKSLDKYYQDASLSGQNLQVALDFMNPYLKQTGLPSQALDSIDQWNNYFLFAGNSLAQKLRDSVYAWNPYLDPMRNSASSLPNFMANMILAPFHIVANAELSDIQKWQSKPFEFPQLLINNVNVINGIRDLNFLDYSKDLSLPTRVSFKVVHAQNDVVVPNTITQELQARLIKEGYSVESVSLHDENHYYLYSPYVDKIYDLIMD